jgi:transcriptional regulator with XRE-family HTH domain
MKAAEFKRIRLKLGLTQANAAEALGFSSAKAVSNIEIGFREPSRLTIAIFSILDELPMKEAKKLVDRLVTKQMNLNSKN